MAQFSQKWCEPSLFIFQEPAVKIVERFLQSVFLMVFKGGELQIIQVCPRRLGLVWHWKSIFVEEKPTPYCVTVERTYSPIEAD